MTEELRKIANDPNYIVEFAVGDPAPELPKQRKSSGLHFGKIYFFSPKRYIMKSAHMSSEDVRIFDSDTGELVMVSHHPGKNPYGFVDPLGLTNMDAAFNVAGGEWESLCDVSAIGDFPSFKIRPKWMSRHGRQYIKYGEDDDVVMNVGKMGRFKTMSMRSQFMIGKGDAGDLVYRCVADMVGRSIGIYNKHDVLIAQVAKTTKALMKTLAFGRGSESTIDIAPGVDCSVILAAIYGMQQVGHHLMGDAFDNYVVNPVKNAVIGTAVDDAGAAIEGMVDGEGLEAVSEMADGGFEAASELADGGLEAVAEMAENEESGALVEAGRFIYETFFA